MKSKFLALLALVMVLAVICTMGVAVFADDTADTPDASADSTTTDETTGDTTSDSADDASDSSTTTGTEEKEEEPKEPTWWDNYNQIIGWIIAGIIFVAIVLVSIWWIKSGFKPSKK